MSDIPESIVDQLAGTGQQRVYLPPKVRESKSTASMESNVTANQAIAAEYFSDGERLHGDKLPEMTIAREQPIHRSMILLHAQGMSAREIAENTGYTPSYVSQVLRQPWARLRLTQYMKEAGIDAVSHFLKHEVSPSLEVIRDVRDDPKARQADRLSAANAILDRALGKPQQTIKSDNTNRNVPSDIVRIDAELARVKAELESKGIESSVQIRN
jgi:hypothetical protein